MLQTAVVHVKSYVMAIQMERDKEVFINI